MRELTARHAFDALYRRWYPVVRDSARSRLPCDADAEDAGQQVFLRLWKRGPDAWQPADPEHFFVTVGHNEALTILRRRSRRNEVSLTPEVAASLESRTLAPDEITARDELRTLVMEALEHLSPRCHEVMSLIIAEGLTQTEVAKRLGISVAAVENQITRGRRALAKSCEWFPDRSKARRRVRFSDVGVIDVRSV